MASTQNSQTVVGVFEDYATAQRAQSVLIRAGVPAQSIDITSESKATNSGQPGPGGHEDGFSGWLSRIFGAEGEAAGDTGDYSEAVRRGHILLSVDVPETEVESVTDILNEEGAMDIDQHVEKWKESGYAAGATSIPVVEEELQVGKRTVQRGGVRVYSRIVDEPVEEQVNLREERVRVERRPVDRPLSEADLSSLQDQTIEVTEMGEEAVVTKRARVVEEVSIGKEASERTETVRDKLRHTEIEVEELPASGTSGAPGKYKK